MTIETCHEQFERDGNPWLTERERRELQASLLPTVGGRRYAKPKLPYTEPAIAKRLPSEPEIRARVAWKNVDLIAQLTGCKPRQLKPIGPQGLKKIVTHIPGPQRVELGWDREEILAEAERQERQWAAFLEQERGAKR